VVEAGVVGEGGGEGEEEVALGVEVRVGEALKD